MPLSYNLETALVQLATDWKIKKENVKTAVLNCVWHCRAQ